jgi:hypothetical protein
MNNAGLPRVHRYPAGGYRTRELARVFRSSHRQLGHSVAYGSECSVLSCVSIAVHAVVKQVSSA